MVRTARKRQTLDRQIHIRVAPEHCALLKKAEEQFPRLRASDLLRAAVAHGLAEFMRDPKLAAAALMR